MVPELALVKPVATNETNEESITLFDHSLMLFGYLILVFSAILNKVESEFEHFEVHHKSLIFFVLLWALVQEHHIFFVLKCLAIILWSQIFSHVFLIFEFPDNFS